MTDQEKVAQWLANGGTITKCPPGPSEGVVYRRGTTFARRKPAPPRDAPAEEPK